MQEKWASKLYGGTWTVVLLLGPALFMFGLFMLWPTVSSLYVAMCSWTGFSPDSLFIGFDNFKNLWNDVQFWAGIKHTLYYVVVGGLWNYVFAFLFAFALNNPRFAGKKFYQTFIFFPTFISVVGVAILWARLYDPQDGLINRLITAAGFSGIDWLSSQHGMTSIIIAAVWAGVGGGMILLLAGMKRIPDTYYEAARIDGATEARVFWHITLPLLKDVIYVSLSLWFIGAMQVFGLVQALAGPDVPLDMVTISTYQYAISFNARDNVFMMGRGTAMSVVLVLMIVFFMGILRLLFGRRELEY